MSETVKLGCAEQNTCCIIHTPISGLSEINNGGIWYKHCVKLKPGNINATTTTNDNPYRSVFILTSTGFITN